MEERGDDNPQRIRLDSGSQRRVLIDRQYDAIGLREFLTVLFKHKRTILATFGVVVAAVVLVTFLWPPTYEANARLLVKFGRENVYRSEVGGDKSQVLSFNSEEVLNSETKILTSRDLIEKAVSAVTVAELYPDLAKAPPKKGTALDTAVERFERALSVEGVKKSNVIQISFRHRSAPMAARALNVLVDRFKEKHLQVYSDTRSSYLEQQLAAYEKRLKDSQERLAAFKQEHGVFSLDEQRSMLLRQRTELDTALKGTENQVRETRERASSLREQLRTLSADVPLSTDTERYRSIDEANGQLLALRLKEQELLRKFTETSQLVVSVRREIQIVESFIRSQEQDIKSRIRTGQNVVYQDLEREVLRLQSDLPSQEAKAASLRSQIAQLDREIPALDMTEMELENLKRDLSVNNQNYRTYVEKLEDARILDDLNRQKLGNISVIQEAMVPTKPVKPTRGLNISLGVVFGALAGLALAFAREYSTQGLSTPESVERRLGLPVLATVPLKR